MNLTNFEDGQLIKHFYDIAGEKLSQDMTDWKDGKKWQRIVSGLPRPAQLVYRIGILNMQVLNGGFVQYYDNRYGIFAYQTLEDLELVGAIKIGALVTQSLLIINPSNYRGGRFYSYIFAHEYKKNWEAFANMLKPLNDKYDQLEKEEHLELLVANYLRKNM